MVSFEKFLLILLLLGKYKSMYGVKGFLLSIKCISNVVKQNCGSINEELLLFIGCRRIGQTFFSRRQKRWKNLHLNKICFARAVTQLNRNDHVLLVLEYFVTLFCHFSEKHSSDSNVIIHPQCTIVAWHTTPVKWHYRQTKSCTNICHWHFRANNRGSTCPRLPSPPPLRHKTYTKWMQPSNTFIYNTTMWCRLQNSRDYLFVCSFFFFVFCIATYSYLTFIADWRRNKWFTFDYAMVW